jgi:hypothetical protein
MQVATVQLVNTQQVWPTQCNCRVPSLGFLPQIYVGCTKFTKTNQHEISLEKIETEEYNGETEKWTTVGHAKCQEQ